MPPGKAHCRSLPFRCFFTAFHRGSAAASEAAIPLVDQQLADKAVQTLGTLANRSKHSVLGDTPPWFVAVGFHLPHLPDLVPQPPPVPPCCCTPLSHKPVFQQHRREGVSIF